MNNCGIRRWAVYFGLAAGWFFNQLGYSQVSLGNITNTTVGGITYFQARAELSLCDTLTTWLLQQGTNFQLKFKTVSSPYCIEIYPAYYTTNVTTVLGALTNGTYLLSIYTPDFDDGEPTFPNLIMGLQVTNAGMPTLSITGSSNTNFSFQIEGVSGARYILERSTNLLNWTAVATNSGAPFTFDAPLVLSETNGFYRTRILSIP